MPFFILLYLKDLFQNVTSGALSRHVISTASTPMTTARRPLLFALALLLHY